MKLLTLYIAALAFAYSMTEPEENCIDALMKCTPPSEVDDSKLVHCRKSRYFLECMENEIRNHNLCPREENEELQETIDAGYRTLEDEGCSGAGTLMSSLLLCLVLSGVAYF